MRRQFRQNTAEWRRVLDECLVLFEVLGSVVPSSQEQKPGALHYRGLGIRHNQLVLASRVNHVRAHLRRRACNQHVPQKNLTMGSPEHTRGAVLSPRFVCSSFYSQLWMPVYRLKTVSLATAFIPVWALYCKKNCSSESSTNTSYPPPPSYTTTNRSSKASAFVSVLHQFVRSRQSKFAPTQAVGPFSHMAKQAIGFSRNTFDIFPTKTFSKHFRCFTH